MPKQSLTAIVRLLRGACPEHHEILPLHFVQGFGSHAQNDTKQMARSDSLDC